MAGGGNIDKKKEFKNADDLFPTIYRIDRIKNYKITAEHFHVQYADRFEEGEFRKRVQFMYGGKLQTIKFRYTGPSIEAILDRLPTAEAKENPDGTWNVAAEVFGKGAEMWLKGQEAYIQELRQRLSLAEKVCYEANGYLKNKDNPLGRIYLERLEDAVKKWDSGRPDKGAQYVVTEDWEQ